MSESLEDTVRCFFSSDFFQHASSALIWHFEAEGRVGIGSMGTLYVFESIYLIVMYTFLSCRLRL